MAQTSSVPQDFQTRRAVVSWFDERKGIGFLQDADLPEGSPGADVFVHYAEIRREGFKTLTPGERVTYQRKPGDGAPKAAAVTPEYT